MVTPGQSKVGASGSSKLKRPIYEIWGVLALTVLGSEDKVGLAVAPGELVTVGGGVLLGGGVLVASKVGKKLGVGVLLGADVAVLVGQGEAEGVTAVTVSF